jgi:hypothetical protein
MTKYPNATEIDNTGVGNQPYVYSIVETRTPIIYQDNHPLMKPVPIPIMGSSLQANVPEFPSLLVVLTLFIAVSVPFSAAVLVRRRKIQK